MTPRGRTLSAVGAAGIVIIAAMRCVIVFLPQTLFDVDPASSPAPVAELGPAGSLLLDVLLVLSCMLGLVGEWRSGRGLDPLLLVLALLPLPVVVWHGANDAGDMWRGSTWLAAAIACATVAHLARDRALRIAMTAGLVAVLVPLLARGATQVTYEHDAFVADYRAHREAILAARGWEPDAPAARIFERRLLHREPIGWFPSTNILGSIIGAIGVMCVGLALVAWRARMQSGWWLFMLMLAAACAAGLWWTSSMGALLATIGGACMLLVIALALRRAPPRGAWIAAALFTLMFGAMAGVMFRGAALPEGFAGDKSLLFRWHYLQSAVAVVSEQPLLGVGADGFQEAYTRHRVPRNPEEVQSTHSIFVDWIATLGIAGGAWAALVITLMARSGATFALANAEPPTDDARRQIMRTAGRFSLIVMALGLVPAMLIEWPTLLAVDIFVRVLAIGGFIAAARMIAAVLSAGGDRWLLGVALAGACVLLVHGQIEMTFFQGGSVVWCMAVVGLMGAAMPARTPNATRLIGSATTLALLMTAGWLLLSGAMPAISQERLMRQAADMLRPVEAQPDDRELELQQRPLVAGRLVEAYEQWPINVRPLNAAVDQLLIAARPVPASASQPGRETAAVGAGVPIGLLIRAEELAERAVTEHNHPSSIVLAMNVHAALATVTDDAEQWSRAIALGRHMAELDPLGVGAWRRLGDVLWAAGEKSDAALAYQKAIANSDNFVLDEMKQLSPARRTELQAQIDQARDEPK